MSGIQRQGTQLMSFCSSATELSPVVTLVTLSPQPLPWVALRAEFSMAWRSFDASSTLVLSARVIG